MRRRYIVNKRILTTKDTAGVDARRMLLLLFALITLFISSACDNKKGNNSSSQATEQSVKQNTEPVMNSTAARTELTVWGMSCNKCVNKITNAVSALDGVISVSVDLGAKKVTVEHKPELDISDIKKSITEKGYNIP